MKQRLLEFDVLKCLSMYMVILGHSIQYVFDPQFMYNTIWQTIYIFHVPLFLVISGFFFKNPDDTTPIWSIVRKKFDQLVYPTIIWGVILLCFLALWSVKAHTFGHSFWGKVYYVLVRDCWFLKSLFFDYIIVLLFFRLKVVGRILLSCVIVSLLYVQNVDLWRISESLPIFVYGIVLRKYYQPIIEHKWCSLFLGSLITVVCLVFWSPNYLEYFSPYNSDLYSLLTMSYRVVIGSVYSTFIIILFHLLIINNPLGWIMFHSWGKTL